MKTTLDLPRDLVRAIKLKAVHEGRTLKDLVADLLQRALALESTGAAERSPKPKRARFPTVKCRHPAASATEMTPERVAEVLLEQETTWHDESRR